MQNSQQMNVGFNPPPSSLLGSDWNSLVDLCSEIQESNFRNEWVAVIINGSQKVQFLVITILNVILIDIKNSDIA